LLLLLVVVFVVVLFAFEENIIECSESFFVFFVVRFETRRTTTVRFARAAMERRKEGKILLRGGEILKRHG